MRLLDPLDMQKARLRYPHLLQGLLASPLVRMVLHLIHLGA